MSTFMWSDAMSLGVPALDTDHKCLVKMINLLDEDNEETWRAGIDPMLKALLLYSRFHFSREERVMQACDFPGTRFHAAEHWNFIREIQRLRRQQEESGHIVKPTRGLIRSLRGYLTDWLFHHILIQDMAFKPYVSEQEGIEDYARAAAPPMKVAEIAVGLARA